MVPGGDDIKRTLTTHLTPNCDKQPQFSDKLINILPK